MSRAITTFLLVAALTALLTALSLAVARHGYPFGAVGVRRLDGIADASVFMPLAALYFVSAALLMFLPLRAASFVLANATDVLFWTVVVLFASIVGWLAARWAFGQSDALWALLDWRFLFVAATVGAHLTLNELRRNVLMRTVFFIVFVAATLACLFWSFEI
ncbi:hypothetical protein [Aquamicrobium sp. LC103]|uniref:hypothetical protein n=1 Tax=Aquamicrobium sp. LC103 TaxID=1120658 RepID=UPI00063E7A1B|nr:hypothetical protein [Aquamicrobium sp. LC103]TKT81191.1 hypothetical protein XW59_004795 [Aquamicrobium sp. LC103]